MSVSRWRPAIAAIGVALAALALCGCLVPDNAYLMELNRNGKWRTAEKVGLDMLAHRSDFTPSQVRETYFHVIYAQTRLGEKTEAVRLASAYDELSAAAAPDPALPWLDREMAKLKDELGLLSPPAQALVEAMTANGRGDYPRAKLLCDEVLGMADASGAQRATASFVAAVCSIRLGDAGAAESYLASFDALKTSLPPGHQALAEEDAARRGLEELKAGKGR